MKNFKKKMTGVTILLVLIGIYLFLQWWNSWRIKTGLYFTGSGTGGTGEDIFLPLINSEYSALVPYWRAISSMETDKYRSRVFNELNNALGMKHPRERATLSVEGTDLNGSGVWWATFNTATDSVADLVLYLREFNYPTKFDSLYDLVSFMGAPNGNRAYSYFGNESVSSYYKKANAHF